MTQRHNKPEYKPVRKYLRNNSTQAEIILWRFLKKKQLNGLKFRRQHSIGGFIVDFYCPEKRLAIELDGDVHEVERQAGYDKARQKAIEALGIKILRFANEEVIENIEGVIKAIAAKAD
ncbi:MAG: endonuclease domain-containing protein [Candidatus Edwardsbacteria bacterium]|nr:endonuclease domain-containing protein [Candidatus Edwardsbacteria bacterium]MBU1576138.1 endonuclease domain-containing protein [Candidatus Edwardsbacteria bacterium]MBU2463456.1 endonuclease domain-containing protein [Candidatus Edwardsbacteria bacterium]MBU2593178.1 endonuclease domain-containing protein [Candidatus Edwardsbacteria bacterium]